MPEPPNYRELDDGVYLESCEDCARVENAHYCLLHSVEIKNANIHACDDWEERRINSCQNSQ